MACCILLDISSVFCENVIFRILAIIFVRFGFFEVFRAFFLQVLRYQFETWYIGQNWSKSFICIHGLQNHIEASDLVHTLILWVSWSLLIFVMVGQFLALWQTKTLKRGVTRAPSQRKVFRTFFVHVVRYQFETWHIHPVGDVTRQVRVSFQSGHFDLLYSQK